MKSEATIITLLLSMLSSRIVQHGTRQQQQQQQLVQVQVMIGKLKAKESILSIFLRVSISNYTAAAAAMMSNSFHT